MCDLLVYCHIFTYAVVTEFDLQYDFQCTYWPIYIIFVLSYLSSIIVIVLVVVHPKPHPHIRTYMLIIQIYKKRCNPRPNVHLQLVGPGSLEGGGECSKGRGGRKGGCKAVG